MGRICERKRGLVGRSADDHHHLLVELGQLLELLQRALKRHAVERVRQALARQKILAAVPELALARARALFFVVVLRQGCERGNECLGSRLAVCAARGATRAATQGPDALGHDQDTQQRAESASFFEKESSDDRGTPSTFDPRKRAQQQAYHSLSPHLEQVALAAHAAVLCARAAIRRRARRLLLVGTRCEGGERRAAGLRLSPSAWGAGGRAEFSN